MELTSEYQYGHCIEKYSQTPLSHNGKLEGGKNYCPNPKDRGEILYRRGDYFHLLNIVVRNKTYTLTRNTFTYRAATGYIHLHIRQRLDIIPNYFLRH